MNIIENGKERKATKKERKEIHRRKQMFAQEEKITKQTKENKDNMDIHQKHKELSSKVKKIRNEAAAEKKAVQGQLAQAHSELKKLRKEALNHIEDLKKEINSKVLQPDIKPVVESPSIPQPKPQPKQESKSMLQKIKDLINKRKMLVIAVGIFAVVAIVAVIAGLV